MTREPPRGSGRGPAARRLFRRPGAPLVASVLLCAGCDVPSRAVGHPTPVATGSAFYAAMSFHGSAIEAVSAETGAVLRKVADGQRDGMDVVGLSAAGPDALLVTYSRGPRCSSGVASCGPVPNTCGAEVVRVPVDGSPGQVLWQVGPDQLLSSAALSPDGSTLAADGSACVPSYFNAHLVVRRLSDGSTWTIGGSVPRCHVVGPPTWLADSTHVVITYAPPHIAESNQEDGICQNDVGDADLVMVDATQQRSDIEGQQLAPAASCTWESTAATTHTIWAVEACGPDSARLQGPANLVQLSPDLSVGRRWPIGECTDGNSLAADDTHDVLVAAYLFCNPPLHGKPTGEPVTVLRRLHDGHLDQFASAPGGLTYWDHLAW